MIQKIFQTQDKLPKDDPRLVAISRIDASYSSHPRIMHSHQDEVEILLVLSGKGVYVVNDTRYDMEKGDLVICNKQVLHDEEPNAAENLSTLCLRFTNIHLKDLDSNCLLPPNMKPLFNQHENKEHIESIMLMLFQLIDDKDASQIVHHLTSSLVSYLIMIVDKHGEQESEVDSDLMQLCKMTKEYINTHYTDDLTLGKIAKAMNISPSYLSHVFKEHIGYSIMNYTLRRRIGESQTLLINTTKSITEIAFDVGYSNPNYFNVVFTKYVGMSPRKYRNIYLQNQGKKK